MTVQWEEGKNRSLQMLLKIFVYGKQVLYNVFNEAFRTHFEAKEVCLVNVLFPSFFLSPAQNTGISTLYRNSYGAPAEDIKHNQVSKETKMLLVYMAYAQKLSKVFKPVTCNETKSSLRPECL